MLKNIESLEHNNKVGIVTHVSHGFCIDKGKMSKKYRKSVARHHSQCKTQDNKTTKTSVELQ